MEKERTALLAESNPRVHRHERAMRHQDSSASNPDPDSSSPTTADSDLDQIYSCTRALRGAF
jgi:hypothetical protein